MLINFVADEGELNPLEPVIWAIAATVIYVPAETDEHMSICYKSDIAIITA